MATNKAAIVWQKNKPVVCFFALLFTIQCTLKIGFYLYNGSFLTHQSTEGNGLVNILNIIKWSAFYDLLVLLFINGPFILLLTIVSILKKGNRIVQIATPVFIFLNLICILLNFGDIFYFHFHLQRADAGLFYVLQHPIQKVMIANKWLALSGFLLTLLIGMEVILIFRKLLQHYKRNSSYKGSSFIISMLLLLLLLFPSARKLIVPTYPLVEINSNQLQLVQNSMHTMLYSLYRKKEGSVIPLHYMSNNEAALLVPFQKKIVGINDTGAKKNIVLFIMESAPEEFFNAASPYKVAMPFLDSIYSMSTCFSQAYSYSYTSNNGIVSILAGLPTLTEIPLYHSQYVNLSFTGVGTELKKSGYSSSFFIGDHYDEFGFAKCCNWLGIDHYYSKEKMEGNQDIQQHTMGLQDEQVLQFMLPEINKMGSPFFAVNYNISTHYPYDIPKGFVDKYKQQNFTLPMQSMAYYSNCLQQFFDKASTQSWYKNSIFIFCADHWMLPNDKIIEVDDIQGFHIPLFIFDPSNPVKKTISSPVSQFDILNTILHIGGIKDSIISYGTDLFETVDGNQRTVFCKKNSGSYVVIDSSYALGFNSVSNQPEFCYNFKTDSARKNNLLYNPAAASVVRNLLVQVKAFLQQASRQYNKLSNR